MIVPMTKSFLAVSLAGLLMPALLPAAVWQGGAGEAETAPSRLELRLLHVDDKPSFELRVAVDEDSFLTAILVSGRGTSTVINARGDRFMDGAHLITVGFGNEGLFSADLSDVVQILMGIPEDWYMQAVVLTGSGELIIGKIMSRADLQNQNLPQPLSNAWEIRLLKTHSIPPYHGVGILFHVNTGGYDLRVDHVDRFEDGRVDIYLVAVSPDPGSMVTMVLETHSVGVDLGRWYGPASLFIADKTQSQGDDGLKFRFAKRL